MKKENLAIGMAIVITLVISIAGLFNIVNNIQAQASTSSDDYLNHIMVQGDVNRYVLDNLETFGLDEYDEPFFVHVYDIRDSDVEDCPVVCFSFHRVYEDGSCDWNHTINGDWMTLYDECVA